MPQTGSGNTAQPVSQLLLRRKVVLEAIRAQVHHADDPGKLSLLNHLEEVGDWVEADLLNDTDIARLGNELTELREIDAALLRVKAGTYGICTDCGNAIPVERMRAQPTAQRCIACQIATDKRQGVGHRTSI